MTYDMLKVCNPVITKLYGAAGGMPGGPAGAGAAPTGGSGAGPTIEEVD